ncbi:MAG: T9SS type A sorting domain-containing protein [Flavobacteriales bacterium]|nr:MAG: T9SS type A sorting domain-containing protein [Flavobacteriales bacterium]
MLRLSTFIFGLCALQLSAQPDSILVGGLQRTYTVRLPSVYDGSAQLPLVIAMHGGFGSGPQLETQSLLSDKAEQEGFIVVYPDGVASPLNIRTWNAGGCCGYAMNNNVDDVGFIDALLDTLITELAIDTLRIYATGMSNGGFMSYRLACELSERLAAIAPVSASMTIDACQPARSVPVIGIHSYLDESVPYLGGIGNGVSNHYNSPQDSVQTAFALHANCAVLNDTVLDNTDLTVVRWHQCDCQQEVLLYMTHDGGHSWPGGAQTGIGDPPSQVANANDLMWDFFQQHTLACGTLSVAPTAAVQRPVLYPQPASDAVTVSGRGITGVAIFDLSGRKVLAVHMAPSNTTTLDLALLPRGSYVVCIADESGARSTLKMVLN